MPVLQNMPIVAMTASAIHGDREKCQASGMDDYPRGPPSAGELHLDLISWMAFFSQTMRDIAQFVGETEDAAAFEEIARATINNIDGA